MKRKKNGKRWDNKSALLLCHLQKKRMPFFVLLLRAIYRTCSYFVKKFACNWKDNKTLSKAVCKPDTHRSLLCLCVCVCVFMFLLLSLLCVAIVALSLSLIKLRQAWNKVCIIATDTLSYEREVTISFRTLRFEYARTLESFHAVANVQKHEWPNIITMIIVIIITIIMYVYFCIYIYEVVCVCVFYMH